MTHFKRPFTKFLVLLAATSSTALTACGRQATAEDCRVIYEKNVEVEMRTLEKADAPTIERKKTDLKAAFEGELSLCVGKRITDSVMACIRNAQTSDEMTRCGHSR
jgi:hypothetical protein